jgi:hypothetical protein
LAYFDPYWVLIGLGAEFGLFAGVTAVSTKKKDLKELPSNLAVSSLVRLIGIPVGLYTTYKFCYDVVRGKKEWMK